MIIQALFIITLTTVTVPNVDTFTAMYDLKNLLNYEKKLVNNGEAYLKVIDETIAKLTTRFKDLSSKHDVFTKSTSTYLENPINAYLLVKRLTTDWKQIIKGIEESSKKYLQGIQEINKVHPPLTDYDLYGAVDGIVRLQDTYELEVNDLSNGNINGELSSKLSSDDCLQIAKQSIIAGNHYYAYVWLQQASKILELEDVKTSSEVDILLGLSMVLDLLGKKKKAIDVLKQLLILDPMNEHLPKNLTQYINLAVDDAKDDDASEIEKPEVEDSFDRYYRRLCRGEIQQPISVTSKLKCRYAKKRHPFTILAPFKEEELNLDPLILLFHDAISESEMKIIKTLAKSKLQQSEVKKRDGSNEKSLMRVSKIAWFGSGDHSVIEKVNNRIQRMTDLEVQFSGEDLQIANYGIGGHYVSHFDFSLKQDVYQFESFGVGNRIATVLLYLSYVTQGGATVFPDIDVTIWPKKGTAAFWYNLLENGDGDMRTIHAACPVLVGNKWVSNKWIHERNQEFIRPCKLKKGQEETSFEEFYNKFTEKHFKPTN